MSQDTLNLFGALISLVVLLWNPIKQAAILMYERAYDRAPDNQHSIITGAVQRAVNAVEQLSHVADDAQRVAHADRKAAATKYAQEILQHFGLKVPDSVIGTYIENAVSQLADSGYSGNHLYQNAKVTQDATNSAAPQDEAPVSSSDPVSPVV